MGYLPQAMANYLALLGWGDGTQIEFFTLEQLGIGCRPLPTNTHKTKKSGKTKRQKGKVLIGSNTEDGLSEVAASLLAAYDNGELLGTLEEGQTCWQKWVKIFGKISFYAILGVANWEAPDMGTTVLLLYKARAPQVEFVTPDERFNLLREVQWTSFQNQPLMESAASVLYSIDQFFSPNLDSGVCLSLKRKRRSMLVMTALGSYESETFLIFN